MEAFHMDFHGLDYQLHSDLEDELMGGELPCPTQTAPPEPLPEDGDDSPEQDYFDIDPDDPDHAGFPEDDEGSCADDCDPDGDVGDEFFRDEDPGGSSQDHDEIFQDEDPEDDGTPSDSREAL